METSSSALAAASGEGARVLYAELDKIEALTLTFFRLTLHLEQNR